MKKNWEENNLRRIFFFHIVLLKHQNTLQCIINNKALIVHYRPQIWNIDCPRCSYLLQNQYWSQLTRSSLTEINSQSIPARSPTMVRAAIIHTTKVRYHNRFPFGQENYCLSRQYYAQLAAYWPRPNNS